MQLAAAAEIAAGPWNERGAVLGMADYFAEEFLLEQESRNEKGPADAEPLPTK